MPGSTASTVRPRPSRSPSDCIVVDTAEGHYTFDSIYPALGSDTHTQLAEMVGAELCERRLHQGRQPPAHQRAGPLCGGRRRDRPRPDQPRDGRRRRCRNHDPQRSVREAAAMARAGSWRKPEAEVRRGSRGRARSGHPPGRRSGLERDQRSLAALELDLEQVAGAVILDRDDSARSRCPAGRRPAGR